MRSILDNLVDGIITIDEAGVIETVNPAVERIFLYPAEELIGRNVSALMSEPDRSAHDAYVDRYCRTGEARIIGIGREVTGRRRDGSVFPIELSIGEFRLGGRRHFTGVIRDISGRKHAAESLEERTRSLDRLRNAAFDPIFVRNAAGEIVSWNEGARKLYGFTAADGSGRGAAKTPDAIGTASGPGAGGAQGPIAFATACRMASPWRSFARMRPSGPMRNAAGGNQMPKAASIGLRS